MKQENKAYIITNELNQRYFHRQSFSSGVVYLSDSRVIFLSWGGTTQDQLPEHVVLISVAEAEWAFAVQTLLLDDRITEIHVEQDIPLLRYQQLSLAISIPIQVEVGYVNGLREIKNEWEIAQLQKACDITDAAFSWILDKIKPGVSELEIAAALEYKMRLLGAEESNKTIVAAGIGGADPHHWPTGALIQKGDFVTMDYGCTVNGYHSDLTRTVVVGKASSAQRAMYYCVLEAQLAALDGLHAGAAGNDIDGIARKIIDHSYEGAFLHNLGHGIGLNIHEGTGLVKNSKAIVKAGMVVSVEPGIYIPGFGGIRIEDIVLVQDTAAIPLEHSDKQLIEL